MADQNPNRKVNAFEEFINSMEALDPLNPEAPIPAEEYATWAESALTDAFEVVSATEYEMSEQVMEQLASRAMLITVNLLKDVPEDLFANNLSQFHTVVRAAMAREIIVHMKKLFPNTKTTELAYIVGVVVAIAWMVHASIFTDPDGEDDEGGMAEGQF